MTKVKELIEQLQKFDPEMPVVYRKSVENGGFIDLELHEPCEFYPGGLCCLSSNKPFPTHDEGVVRKSLGKGLNALIPEKSDE